jgi:GTP-binding protein Era
MNREAWAVLADADCVVYLMDATRQDEEQHEADRAFLRSVLKDYKGPVFLCLNKCDKMKKDEIAYRAGEVEQLVLELKESLGESRKAEIVGTGLWTISAKRKDSLTELLTALTERLPEGPWLYPDDELTDRPQKFVVSELIREQAFRCLGAELPYHLAVQVDDVVFEGNLVRVFAELVVGRMQHKAIVLGKAGSKIKEIGTKARVSLELHFSQKVFLQLEVVVDEGWVHDPYSVTQYSEFFAHSSSASADERL